VDHEVLLKLVTGKCGFIKGLTLQSAWGNEHDVGVAWKSYHHAFAGMMVLEIMFIIHVYYSLLPFR